MASASTGAGPAPDATPRADVARWLGALLAVWMALHLVSGRAIADDDGRLMLEVSRAIAAGERPPTVHFGVGQSLLELPVAPAIDSARWDDPDRYTADNWLVKLVPALLGALSIVLVHDLLRRAGASRRRAIATAAIVAMGTPLLVYARLLFAEVTLAACLLLSLLPLAWRDPRRASAGDLAWAGFGLGFGLLTKVSFVVAIGPVLGAILWRERALGELPIARRAARLLALGAPLVAAVAVAALWNVYRYGSPLENGYRDHNDALGFSWRFAKVGIPGLLGSTGESVFLYAPPLLVALPLWRRFARGRGALAAACWLSFLGSLVLHGSWWAWHGDWAWGPRFLVPYVPPLCLSIAEMPLGAGALARAGAALAAAVVAAGVAVQAVAISVNNSVRLVIEVRAVHFSAVMNRDHTDLETTDELRHAHFIPEFSPIVVQAWLLRSILTRDPQPSRTCPWRAIGPSEWTSRLDGLGLDGLPLDFWVLPVRSAEPGGKIVGSDVPHREDRIVGELCVLLAGLALAMRRPNRSPLPQGGG